MEKVANLNKISTKNYLEILNDAYIYKNKSDIFSAESDVKAVAKENQDFMAKMDYVLRDYGIANTKDLNIKSIIDFNLLKGIESIPFIER